MEPTLVLQNIAHGGFRLSNAEQLVDDRWEAIYARLTSGGPADLVVLNECAGWQDPPAPYLRRAADALGMQIAGITAVASRKGQPSVILYRPEVLGECIDWHDAYADQFLHGYGTAVFTPPGFGDDPFTVTVGHLDPFTRAGAVREAETLATHAMRRTQRRAVLAGDLNSCPLTGPEHGYGPDIANMTDYNKGTRLNDPFGPNPTPNTEVAQRIADYGFRDAADLAYAKTGDRSVYAHTGKTDRIDRVHVKHGIDVIAYQRLTEPVDASDHAGLRVRLRIDPGSNTARAV